jgi:hypothetical protein
VASIRANGLGVALGAGAELLQAAVAARKLCPDAGRLIDVVGSLQQSRWYGRVVPLDVARRIWGAVSRQTLLGQAETEAWDVSLAYVTRPVVGEAQLVSASTDGLLVHDYLRTHMRIDVGFRRQALDHALPDVARRHTGFPPRVSFELGWRAAVHGARPVNPYLAMALLECLGRAGYPLWAEPLPVERLLCWAALAELPPNEYLLFTPPHLLVMGPDHPELAEAIDRYADAGGHYADLARAGIRAADGDSAATMALLGATVLNHVADIPGYLVAHEILGRLRHSGASASLTETSYSTGGTEPRESAALEDLEVGEPSPTIELPPPAAAPRDFWEKALNAGNVVDAAEVLRGANDAALHGMARQVLTDAPRWAAPIELRDAALLLTDAYPDLALRLLRHVRNSSISLPACLVKDLLVRDAALSAELLEDLYAGVAFGDNDAYEALASLHDEHGFSIDERVVTKYEAALDELVATTLEAVSRWDWPTSDDLQAHVAAQRPLQ